MGTFRRALLTAAAVACALASASGSAGATTPDPYGTTTATGRLTFASALGVSPCTLTGINASIASNVGPITSVTVAGCRGIITTLTSALAISLAFDLSTVDPGVTVFVGGITLANVLGGVCLYTGTLTGSGTDGTGNMAARGQLALNPARSTGICSNPQQTSLEVSFPGLSL